MLMKCPICSSTMNHVFMAKILGKYDVSYYQCNGCGLLQTEEPYWVDEAYSDAIALADTGIIQRNLSIAAKLSVLLYYAFDPRESFLDVAGGYGILTRLMRDIGFDYYWDDKYCDNQLARGFETSSTRNVFNVLTAFEVFEHIHDPLSFINEIMKKYNANTMIFTTELYEGKFPEKDWWYYAFNSGQHISFYQSRTLKRISEQLDLRFYSFNGIHIITNTTIKHVWLLKLLTKRSISFLVTIYIRYRLGSRTVEDHYALLKNKHIR